MQPREPSVALCDHLEEWDGRSGRRLGEEGICVIMADLHGCMAETDITF